MPKTAIGRSVPGQTWRDLICDDYDGDDWVKREENFAETWRWGNWYEVIVEHVPTGTFFMGMYRTGGDSDGLDDVNDFREAQVLYQVSREPKTVWDWKVMHEPD